MKKKAAAVLFTGALLVSLGTTGVLAGGHGHGRNHMGRNCSSERNVCIYQEQDRVCVCGQEKEKREGICGECPGFEDEDHDGICDHHKEERCSSLRGQGCHRRNRR